MVHADIALTSMTSLSRTRVAFLDVCFTGHRSYFSVARPPFLPVGPAADNSAILFNA